MSASDAEHAAGVVEPRIAILYRRRTCPEQTLGRTRANLGRAAGRDLLPPEVTLARRGRESVLIF